MTESDEVQFQERVAVAGRPAVLSLPVRVGIAAGAAVLVVVGAVADRDGTAALSDIEVGDLVIAQGTLLDDGSLDADVVHTGKPRFRDGFRDGFRHGPGFPGPDGAPGATPTPDTSSSAS